MSLSNLPFLPDALLNEIGHDIAFGVCGRLNDVFHTNGIGTYEIATRQKEAYRGAGEAVLKAAAHEFVTYFMK